MATSGAALLIFVLVFGILAAQKRPYPDTPIAYFSTIPSLKVKEQILSQAIKDTIAERDRLRKSNDSLDLIRPKKGNEIIAEIKKRLAIRKPIKTDTIIWIIPESEHLENDYFCKYDTIQQIKQRIDTIYIEKPRRGIFGFLKKKKNH